MVRIHVPQLHRKSLAELYTFLPDAPAYGGIPREARKDPATPLEVSRIARPDGVSCYHPYMQFHQGIVAFHREWPHRTNDADWFG